MVKLSTNAPAARLAGPASVAVPLPALSVWPETKANGVDRPETLKVAPPFTIRFELASDPEPLKARVPALMVVLPV